MTTHKHTDTLFNISKTTQYQDNQHSTDNKKQHWKRSMKYIYKDGVTDPDYCILKFTATNGRYYSMLRSQDLEIAEL
jgi:general stress protein 26